MAAQASAAEVGKALAQHSKVGRGPRVGGNVICTPWEGRFVHQFSVLNQQRLFLAIWFPHKFAALLQQYSK